MTISIDPVLVAWGGFTLHWYGLIVLVSICLGLVVSRHEANRRGLLSQHIDDLALTAILFGVIGARLFHALDNWDRYASAPVRLLAVHDGGLAIYGALTGGALATVLYARIHRISFWRLADILTPGVLLAQMTGRLAYMINGDASGGPTSVPWAITYTNPAAVIPDRLLGVPTHPYPIYETIWNIGVFIVIWRLRAYLVRPGSLFLLYVALYSLGRFVLSNTRQEAVVLFGLQEAQVIALLLLVVASLVVILRMARSALGGDTMVAMGDAREKPSG